eukprot:652485-Amorphochlora_amoeboformis.AAC.1
MHLHDCKTKFTRVRCTFQNAQFKYLALDPNPSTNKTSKILELIPKVHQFNHVADNTGMPKNDKRAFGAATQAGAMLLEKIGGKLILVLSKLPDHGVGKLESRDDIKLYHTSKESTLLIPQGSFYSKLATFCAQ